MVGGHGVCSDTIGQAIDDALRAPRSQGESLTETQIVKEMAYINICIYSPVLDADERARHKVSR